MTCERCSEAIEKGEKFCSNCGNATTPLTVELLSGQLAALSAQIEEYRADRRAQQQNYVELDTAEKIVTRVMSWAKLFGFFVGVPLGLVLVVLSLWAGKSIKDLHDIARAGQASVQATLENAKRDAKAAEAQASQAVSTAQTVSRGIQDTNDKLTALDANVNDSSSRVHQLNTGVSQQETRLSNLSASAVAQNRVIEDLASKVQTLNNNQISQDIGRSHPELGVHVVYGPSGILTAAKKPTGKLYVQVELYNQDNVKPSFTSEQITNGIASLQKHGFITMFGQVALFASTGQTSTPIAGIGLGGCQLAHLNDGPDRLGLPCIVYFRENLREKAIEARNAVTSVQTIADNRIRFVPAAALSLGQKELLDKSELDMIVLFGP